MAAMVREYFSSFFTADMSLQANPVTSLIDIRVNDLMNEGLCADFSDKEIADALF